MDLYGGDIPSMDNYYNSSKWLSVKNDQHIKANVLKEKSKNPYRTGVVSSTPLFNKYQNVDNLDTNTFFSLTGEMINADDMKHNNMQHFLKKSVTQNVKTENFIVDRSSEIDKLYNNKKETPSFFKPTSGFDNINGAKNNSDYLKNRINISDINNNSFPINKVNVGPGINAGFSSEGIGGYQQINTLEYAKPKNIDELRTKINQKNKYFEIPIKGPKNEIGKRGMLSNTAKNRPEKVYKKTEADWFKTTGSIIKKSLRSFENVKATNKQDSHISYSGNIKYNNSSGLGDDYGKKDILIYDNERKVTETKTNVSNITSIVKSIVAPVIDAVKFSTKEYTVNAPRETGNLKGITEKATLYDPVNHVTRTTIKETTIHDSELNNLSGPSETYTASHDQAKTTVKETTIHDSETNNLSGPNETYTASHDQAKTTIKETIIHDTDILNIKGEDKNYVTGDDSMRVTMKETIPLQDNIRNIGNINYKTYVYDTDIVAKTTVKETLIKGKSEYGFLGGVMNSLFGGYFNKKIDLKNTNKQYTSDYQEYGIAGSVNDHRQYSRDAYYEADNDDTREKILIAAGHIPNPGNMNIGIDKKEVNMTSTKNPNDNIAKRSMGNIGKIYESGPQYIKDENITKYSTKINTFDNRLDSKVLDSLKTNELNTQINPIV